MTPFIAFLRAINVGGHNKIKMSDLKSTFEELGFANVKTFIQSGNIFFESSEKNTEKLEALISKKIKSNMNMNVPCMIRKVTAIEAIVKNNPAQKIKIPVGFVADVTFLKNPIKPTEKFPLTLAKGDLKLIAFNKTELYSIHRAFGKSPSIPSLTEKWGSVSTTRKMDMVKKMLSSQKGT